MKKEKITLGREEFKHISMQTAAEICTELGAPELGMFAALLCSQIDDKLFGKDEEV